MTTADEVLKVRYPGYQPYLDAARAWMNGGDPAQKREAVRLLEGVRKRYPAAPQVGQVLVLALMEAGDRPRAEVVLREVEKDFVNPDEEMLSRWGRLFREKGDEYAAGAEADAARRERAVWHYERALEKYEAAARVRDGHYPLINVAELCLTLASWDERHRPALVARCDEAARELLARQPWPATLSDDNIWHLATAAQAHWLTGDAHGAAARYREAVQEGNCQPFHVESMRRGAERTQRALQRLGRPDLMGPLADLSRIFPAPPPPAPPPEKTAGSK